MMRLDEIQRRQERLILAEAVYKFDRLFLRRCFGTADLKERIDLGTIMRVMWWSTLHGKGITAQQIGLTVGMPRTTVIRKMRQLSSLGYVTLNGTKYAIRDEMLRNPHPTLLDGAIKLVIDTANALRAVAD